MADAEIRALAPQPRRLFNNAVRNLRRDYLAGDTLKLSGYETLWRVRIGRRRIIFSLNLPDRDITILRVARREVAYDNLDDLLRDEPPSRH